ncbi:MULTISPECIES: hypothetical protein [unclassified Halorhodospira]|uniref:hypothetical protein n=1 Tax=unclassified Halorhodospira TaxID=2626748 RepID=UPI001EE97BBC|nr:MULTISPECIES: hypothetical protein [unclassified Halorhodospira]MCG5541619.1 hypothetical protein [Halorhodospira sp. M39old]MCG5546554.1 hypothetical protein [Halorhodospira sp. M38]
MPYPRLPLTRWRLWAPRGAVLVNVNPQQIVYRKRWQEWPAYLKRWPFWIIGGDWDAGGRELPPFRVEQMRELLAAEGAFRDTPYYAAACAELEQNGFIAEPYLTSRASLDAYLDRQVKILLDIREHGYAPQRELGGKRSHDLTVRIDRQGRLVKCREGTHRHAMLLALGVQEAPVTVDVVHTEWARACYRRFGGPLATALRQGLEADYGPVLEWPWSR